MNGPTTDTDSYADTGSAARARAVQHLADRWIRDALATGKPAEGGSFVCSPAGLWLALAAVAAGARGGTARELRALLGTADREAASVVTAAARELALTGALGVATRVWSRVPVADAYREALPDVRFDAMDPAAADAWVREATGGLIGRLPLEITDGTLLALVNVLALKARWEKPFDAWRTRDLPFTDASGATRPVPTMAKDVPLADVWAVDGTYVVELRCTGGPGSAGGPGGGGARVRFVLGEPGAGAGRVLSAGWADRAAGAPPAADRVTIALPRLTLRTRVAVTGQLPALGIRLATSDAADFSGLSPEPLAISDVVQEAVLKVAEEGVEAAAVTVVAMRAGSAAPPPQRLLHLAFDRPFGIVVLPADSDVPLFTAWQADTPADPA
ncbi:serpin family protein [Streptomyces microflavus]|uniref:serpin family protein n=1 Tax=Streptomyces microflavus TaxID=1919 RepID=UPI002E337755|nr:serpin family protein [Streptomyces microflavus]